MKVNGEHVARAALAAWFWGKSQGAEAAKSSGRQMPGCIPFGAAARKHPQA